MLEGATNRLGIDVAARKDLAEDDCDDEAVEEEAENSVDD